MPAIQQNQVYGDPITKILQKHSINSLVQQNILKLNDSELLGLDSPRGLLGSTFGNSSPGLSPTENLQLKCGDNKLINYASVASATPKRNAPMSAGSSSSSSVIFHFQDHSIKPYNEKSGASQKRNIPLSAGSSTASPPIYYPEHSMRSFWDPSGCNDSSGSNSPSAVELSPPLSSSSSSSSSSYNPVSRSNSPADSDNSAISSPDGSLTEFLNFLTLNDAFTRNYLNNEIRSDLDLNNLQNLQVIHAMKYLQQPPAILNSLLNSTCSHNTSTNQLPDKWCSAGGGGAAANHLRLMQLKLQENNNHHLDRAARFHRSAAAVFDATCTWSGVLPIRSSKPIGYSNKVFLGGVPWDISEQLLVQTFKQFGPIRVEWPGKDKQAIQPKGYCYIILEGEKNVKALLNACSNNFENSGNWYFKISSKRMKSKEVQVIPWILNDSNYTKSSSQKLDPSKTVFVGALHGMLNAEGLANIMNDLFDGVVYAGIDTDKYKYPIGSGRVTFNNHRSYMRAVSAAFIEIKTAKFTKKVQVDPYLEDSLCSVCALQQGPYFCREQLCFRYYCRTCWQYQHNSSDCQHKPLMRNSKNSTVLGLGNANLAAN